jgi:hypothetical protein
VLQKEYILLQKEFPNFVLQKKYPMLQKRVFPLLEGGLALEEIRYVFFDFFYVRESNF